MISTVMTHSRADAICLLVHVVVKVELGALLVAAPRTVGGQSFWAIDSKRPRHSWNSGVIHTPPYVSAMDDVMLPGRNLWTTHRGQMQCAYGSLRVLGISPHLSTTVPQSTRSSSRRWHGICDRKISSTSQSGATKLPPPALSPWLPDGEIRQELIQLHRRPKNANGVLGISTRPFVHRLIHHGGGSLVPSSLHTVPERAGHYFLPHSRGNIGSIWSCIG